MHGHNYVLEIEISGRQCPTLGWLMDFAQIDVIVKDLVIRFLDHVVLNEVPGLENPTSEVLVNWIWDRLSIYGWRDGLTLSRVRVSETPTSWAERVPYES
jgi:6-pyruvoyltetrahydropterin/6-carboxytetrahydropterin synthase